MAEILNSRVDEGEWQRLRAELAYLFAREVRMSRWQYEDTLPKYVTEPSQYKDRFNRLVLVQPPKPEVGLTLTRISKIAGLYNKDANPPSEVYDSKQGGFKTPDVAYATWVNSGNTNKAYDPKWVFRTLADDERPGTGLDGIFLYVADKSVYDDHHPYLPGSGDLEYVHAVYIRRWDGEWPKLGQGYFGESGFGVVTAGREIVLGTRG